MFGSRLLFSLLLFLTGIIYSQSTNVTIYNDNLGVVKEVRTIKIPDGESRILIDDVPSGIDPTSVHVKFNGTIIEQNYKYDLANMGTILEKYLGKTITVINDKGEKISGKLLSSGSQNIVLQKKNGGLLMIPDFSKYTISVDKLPQGLITVPTLEYLLKSENGGKENFELSYSTSGMNWNAEYVVVLNKDDSALNLNSWLSISNESGKTFKKAKLKLVAGEINRVRNRQQPIYMTAKSYATDNAMVVNERNFFEYHIYEVPRPTTLRNNEQKQIAFIKADNIKINKKYSFLSYLYSDSDKKNVDVIITFENKKDNNLGIPFPAGKVRIFKKDEGSLELIGEDFIKHTPKDEQIKLKVGKAFDVLASSNLIRRERISKNIIEVYKEVTVTNHKDKNINVYVTQRIGENGKVISSNYEYEKEKSNSVLFKLPVQANDKTKLTMKIRIKHVAK